MDAKEAESRKIYEKYLRNLATDIKLTIARTEQGNNLAAICFDQSHAVIAAAINNPSFGLEHARLIAKYHHTSEALEFLTRRPDFVADAAIRSALYKNTFAGEVVLDRCFRTLTLFGLYNLCYGHEATEKAAKLARASLRDRFEKSAAEQCADFIIKTEGRCLKYLIGLRLNQETARILANHQFTSLILVRNLLIFPGLPPEVLRGIAKSAFVWRSAEFKKMILAHSNCPADVKNKK